MRKLHLVGLTTDRDGLIFTARKGSKSGGYIVPLDDRVLGAVAEARNGAPDGPDGRSDSRAVGSRAESALTPREMQARLRAGRTIAEVAAEAGVDTEWVARFAVPILAEQAQVVELARGLTYAKPRLGESSQPLGAAVVLNLSDKGVFLPDDLADAGWSAFQLHDAVWMVRFRYRSRGRDQEAQWEVDVPAGRLVARNRHASDLGYVDLGRRRHALPDEEDEALDGAEPPPRRRAPAPRRAKAATGRARAAKAAPAKARATKARATKARASAASAARAPAKRAGAAKAAPGRAVTQARAAKGAPRQARAASRVNKGASTAKAASRAKAAAPVKAGTAKAPARRRPAKAGGASEVGPAAGAGGVRLAVARVSTARLAASMATTDRAPWAAAVRARPGARPTIPAPQPGAWANGGARTAPSPRQRPEREPRAEERDGPPAFTPRPLPDGVEIERPAGRRPPPPSRPPASPAPPATRVAKGEPPPVSLPAPRLPARAVGPISPERPKRRRLRSR